MSYFENRTPTYRQLPNSTQLFEKIYDEIVNDDIRTDIASIYSELFDRSPDYNSAPDDKYRDDKPTENFITKLPQPTDIMSSTIIGDIEPNDSNLSSVYGQYQMYSRNRILDRCSSTQESLCTECRFGNGLNNLFASINTTQHQTQSSCSPSVIGDRCDKRRLLRKRPISVTPKKRNSELQMRQFLLPRNNLKKSKSEGSISTFKNTGSNIWAPIRPTIVTHKISVPNSTHIDQTVEPSVCSGTIIPDLDHSNDISKHIAEIEQTSSELSNYDQGSSHLSLPHQVQSKLLEQTERVKIITPESTAQDVVEEMLIDENTATDNKTNRRSFNEMILSQSQIAVTNDSNLINTTVSRSTIEKIYHTDITDEIEDLKTVDLVKEIQETDSLKHNNSPFNPSSLKEVDCINDAADIVCLADVEATNEMLDYLTAEENSAPRIINEEIIRGKQMMSTTVMDFGFQRPINSRPNEMDTVKDNPLSFSCNNDSESEICAVSNTRTEDDLQFQCLNETQLKSTGREVKISTKDMGRSIHPIDDPVTTVDSAKDPQYGNGENMEAPADSILEITVVSESDSILEQDTIIGGGGINPVHSLDNLNRKSTISKSTIKDKRDTRNGPVDFIVDTNSNRTAIVIPSTDDDFDISSLTGRQLETIERQVGMVTKGISSDNSTVNSGANITSIKYPNIPSKIVQTLRDDLSLEFLSETELQRIEEDAYMKTKGAASAINLNNQNIKSVANEQDVFYRPERLNITNEDSDNGLVIPNWVMSPSPEPNYGKVKCVVQTRRQYMEKMLQEILRLSTIVSKVGSIVYAGNRNSDSGAMPNGSSQIQDSHPIHSTEINANNRSVDFEASGSGCGNLVPEDSGIFYVPHSDQSKYNAPSDKVTATVSTSRITTNISRKDPEGNNRLYAPRSNRSKYDAATNFNRPNEIELNKGNISSSCMQSDASNLFGSLKHDFDGDRTRESDISSVWYTGKRSEIGIQIEKSNSKVVPKNKEYLEDRMKEKYQMPKISLNATVSIKDKMGLGTNKFGPVVNNTIFYLPDKLSSESNNNTMKNSPQLSPVNFTKRPSVHMKVDEPRPQNFGKSLPPHAISNDNSIFYNGDKKRGTTFDIL